MKKLFLLLAVTLMVATISNAQTNETSLRKDIKMDKKDGNKTAKKDDRKTLRKLEGSEVSYQSKQAFAMDFENITPTSSSRQDYFDVFKFTENGKEKTAFYDIGSKLIGTIQNKTFADLPLKGQEGIRKHYADYTPGLVVFFDDNENNDTDMFLYGIQFDDTDSYFVEMNKGNNKIVLHLLMNGDISFFTQLK